jgi:uncharacterized protein YheU (UPF0270 family)
MSLWSKLTGVSEVEQLRQELAQVKQQIEKDHAVLVRLNLNQQALDINLRIIERSVKEG